MLISEREYYRIGILKRAEMPEELENNRKVRV